LESTALGQLVALATPVGLTAATAIALLIFCGAVGKSGQVPLHVWLPDAMEGPTPVSALIHAATMVAAGVFLVARVYPLMDADVSGLLNSSTALSVVTWVGAITAVTAALIATAQNDIKRILAYSTVSQLGYMMMGLGVGGVAVGMFHLITHAFFKALLFLGAGSVIHGCHGEQDIRRMGGLRKYMPVTFATYAVGMLALAGVPLFFSGFWSKDEILHAAFLWQPSKLPFLLGLVGAFLTAFYMTRQVLLVFYGEAREGAKKAHESPSVMTLPLVVLAVCAMLLGVLGTPAWPWFHSYLTGHHVEFNFSKLFSPEFLFMALLSTVVVFAGLALGWKLYNGKPGEMDPLERFQPGLYPFLQNRLYFDELYAMSFGRWMQGLGRASEWVERTVLASLVSGVQLLAVGVSWLGRFFERFVIDGGFDKTCAALGKGAEEGSKLQDGQVQNYLRTIGVAFAVLILFLAWGCRP
jgi:NADH-quinone oxidoreductase subunit L